MIEDGDEQLNDDSHDDEKLETVGKIETPDPIDDWLPTLGGEGIEVVDSASRVKEPDKSAPGEVVPEEEAEPEPVLAAEEEEEDNYAKTNDPVRMYLRKMGSVSLLTREGEVEIAKRMEEGERRVLQVVLNSSVAIEETLDLGDKLRQQKIRVNEVVKDADEEDAVNLAVGLSSFTSVRSVLRAKGQSDAMQYTLPLKQKQIEQTRLEAEARAQARVINGKAELEHRKLMNQAEVDRVQSMSKADTDKMRLEAGVLKDSPVLLQKIIADKLSDKVQIMMVPSDGKFFFANDVLKAAPAAAASDR